jgi:hypothetical protein
LLDEINKLAAEGLTEQELSPREKEIDRPARDRDAKQTIQFGYQCALDELYGLGSIITKISSATPKRSRWTRSKQVSAKYFRDQPYVLATVHPSDKK